MRKIAVFVAALVFSGLACAQSYPARAVKVVVPWPPGQATDIAARIVAQKLQESLGQPFVIDNRAGAGGSIGSDAVAKSANDGYTLLASSSGPISIMPNLQKTPYDSLKDFAPVSLIALKERYLALGLEPAAMAPDEMVAFLRREHERYGTVIRNANIKID